MPGSNVKPRVALNCSAFALDLATMKKRMPKDITKKQEKPLSAQYSEVKRLRDMVRRACSKSSPKSVSHERH